MFSHVMVGTTDLDRSIAFYDAVLGVLGAAPGARSQAGTGHWRAFWRHAGASFGVCEPINGEPATVANGGTIGFLCESPEQVLRFHEVALAHGGTAIEAPPGPREGPAGVLHLAYVRDPDGHKLCALHRPKRAG
jgi:catechol 2,3-dioxygenase-like lactoylglutathione lyase family enzyme